MRRYPVPTHRRFCGLDLSFCFFVLLTACLLANWEHLSKAGFQTGSLHVFAHVKSMATLVVSSHEVQLSLDCRPTKGEVGAAAGGKPTEATLVSFCQRFQTQSNNNLLIDDSGSISSPSSGSPVDINRPSSLCPVHLPSRLNYIQTQLSYIITHPMPSLST